jgi:hypothetical protein
MRPLNADRPKRPPLNTTRMAHGGQWSSHHHETIVEVRLRLIGDGALGIATEWPVTHAETFGREPPFPTGRRHRGDSLPWVMNGGL